MSRILTQIQQTSQRLRDGHEQTIRNIDSLVQSLSRIKPLTSEHDLQTEEVFSPNLDFLNSDRQLNDTEVLDFLQSTTKDQFETQESGEEQAQEEEEDSYYDQVEESASESESADGKLAYAEETPEEARSFSQKQDPEGNDEFVYIEYPSESQEDLDYEFQQIMADELIYTSSESKKKDVLINQMRGELELLKQQFQTVKSSPAQIVYEQRQIAQLEAKVADYKHEIKRLKLLCNEKDNHFRTTFSAAYEKFLQLQSYHGSVEIRAEVLSLRKQLSQEYQTAVQHLAVIRKIEEQLRAAYQEVDTLKHERQFSVPVDVYKQLYNDALTRQKELDAALQAQNELGAQIYRQYNEIQQATVALRLSREYNVRKEEECYELQSRLISAYQEKYESQLQKIEVQMQLNASQKQQELERFERLTPIDLNQEEVENLTQTIAELRSQIQTLEKRLEMEALASERKSALEVQYLNQFIEELQRVNEELQQQCYEAAQQLKAAKAEQKELGAALMAKNGELEEIVASYKQITRTNAEIREQLAEQSNNVEQARIFAEKCRDEKAKAERALRIQMEQFQRQMALFESCK